MKGKEYFLSYEDYPYFTDQTLSAIQNVQLLHGYHLFWILAWMWTWKSTILNIRRSIPYDPG